MQEVQTGMHTLATTTGIRSPATRLTHNEIWNKYMMLRALNIENFKGITLNKAIYEIFIKKILRKILGAFVKILGVRYKIPGV